MATSVTFGVQPRRAAVGATFQATPNSFPYSRDQWPALITGGAGDLSANFFQLLNQIPAEWCWIYSAAQALMVSQSLDGQSANRVVAGCLPGREWHSVEHAGAIGSGASVDPIDWASASKRCS